MVVLTMETFSKRGRLLGANRSGSPPCRAQTSTFGVVVPARVISGTQKRVIKRAVPPPYTTAKKKTASTPPASPATRTTETKTRSKSCALEREKIKKSVSFTAPPPIPPSRRPSPSPLPVQRTETSTANPFKSSCAYMSEDGGSILLSVCPGKKMKQGRNGKAYARSLKQDLLSVKERAGLSMVVCLLNNAELRTLGVKPEQYVECCKVSKIKYVQYPMIEMAAPTDCASFDESVIQPVIEEVKQCKSVLVHCRGGVGRAGLLAACALLRVREVKTADEAIATVRKRRDPRAVESQNQVNFVRKYAIWLSTADGLDDLELSGSMPLSARGSGQAQQPGVHITAARRTPLNMYNNSTGNIMSADTGKASFAPPISLPTKLYRRSSSNCFQSKSPFDDKKTRRSLSQCVSTVSRNLSASGEITTLY